ncbi:hypothetical protein GCM10011416_01520 [Polaribacter pacificus]|uniref:DUF5683 domain-containing protein n=1 Tax=Polaribacter pacificus TaxID=1775173 RepID=A0A917HUD9_9FLAO|nr:DUF5683 domain-containing protein [Polaribacter pacificus]GGG88858.1 hypothetical protein GCM10011416_01520 [Polaribacter pacificus]
MSFRYKITICICVFTSFCSFAQKDTVQTQASKTNEKIIIVEEYKPLAPAKAAFYSAVLPGLGQIYNKKYWKAPVVWAAMSTSIYLYIDNNKEFDRYRTAFKLREAGLKDEFTNDDGSVLISRNGLINAQKTLRQNRDLSLLTTAVFYVLQIIEASVNAHLLQFNTNDNLTFQPMIQQHPMNFDAPKFGLSFKYSF